MRINRKAVMADKLRKKAAMKKPEKKICLACIMKNESKNVNRLLDSLRWVDAGDNKYLIDMISVVDTGSTDNTKELIIKWGRKHSIPTTVHEEPFKNFAYNRTHSIKAAKEAYPDADYFLLSDADFIWQINVGGKFDKRLLIDHKYLIEQSNQILSYLNVRLLSAQIDWVCEGVTHEYWTNEKEQKNYLGEIRTGTLTTIKIDDREDGGCKDDKFVRDERLLREGLDDEKTPKHLKTRYKFYLAQTLRDLKRHEESIKWYKERVKDKGWEEEVYYSKFQIGHNYKELMWIARAMGDENHEKYFVKAKKHYLQAYEYRNTRAEALYHFVKLCRELGKNDLAYEYAIKGKKIKQSHDSLFLEKDCYTYLFDYEISIVAFYVPDKKEEGRKAICSLLERDDIHSHLVEIIKNNSRAYL
jgi:glycosyltransferase involved in cell wall biosynthesis